MKFQNMSDRQIVFRLRDERFCQCSGQSKLVKLFRCTCIRSCDWSCRAGIGGVTVWMLSRTEGVGVGGCGACVGCAPVPWSVLASPGKFDQTSWRSTLSMFGSIKWKLTTLLLQWWRFLCAKQLIERNTKLHRNRANFDRGNNLRNSQKRWFLWAK